MRGNTHTHTHTHTCIRARACVCACVRACVRAYIKSTNIRGHMVVYILRQQRAEVNPHFTRVTRFPIFGDALTFLIKMETLKKHSYFIV